MINVFKRFTHKISDSDKRAIKIIIGLFIAVKIILFLAMGISASAFKNGLTTLPDNSTYKKTSANVWNLESQRVWDSEFYIRIAEHGYKHDLDRYHAGSAASIAFFPGYPLTVSVGHKILPFISIDTVAALLSNLYFLGACFLLYRMIKERFDEDTAIKSVILLFAFPPSFIFGAAFTESLFLLVSIAAVYSAEKGKFVWASVFATIAMATRPVGFITFVPVIMLFWKKRKEIKQIAIKAFALIIFPTLFFASYMYLNWSVAGKATASLDLQTSAWSHAFTNPITLGFMAFTKGIAVDKISFAWMMLVFGVIVAARKKLPDHYIAFALLMVLIVPLTGTLIGAFRYMLPIFPLFPALALLFKKEYSFAALLVALSLIQGIFFVWWIGWFEITL